MNKPSHSGMNPPSGADSHSAERAKLRLLLASIRRRIFLQEFFDFGIHTALFAFPAGAVAIAVNQLSGPHISSWNLLWGVGGATLVVAAIRAVLGFRAQAAAALAFDAKADLRDRVSSALSFLQHRDKTSIPEKLQIADAIQCAEAVNANRLFRLQLPSRGRGFALASLLLAASLFLPSPAPVETAQAAIDAIKQQQIEELDELEKELAVYEEEEPEVQEALEKLRQIQKQFKEGDLSDRDLMIELARLSDELQQKRGKLGVQQLESELNIIVPHLMGSDSTKPIAAAIQKNQMNKAAKKLEELSEKARKEALTEADKKQMAVNLGTAVSKLGSPSGNSFAGDFSKASEALKNSDTKSFCAACKSISDKFKRVGQAKKMAMACNKLGECKASIGQCNVGGYKLADKNKSNKKGSLPAGTDMSNDPFNDPTRLEDSYRQLLRVTGQVGEGPVETETEITEGQLSPSRLALKNVHAEFEAAAETAIENETIPLSRRFHVKRYFQTIRPKE